MLNVEAGCFGSKEKEMSNSDSGGQRNLSEEVTFCALSLEKAAEKDICRGRGVMFKIVLRTKK